MTEVFIKDLIVNKEDDFQAIAYQSLLKRMDLEPPNFVLVLFDDDFIGEARLSLVKYGNGPVQHADKVVYRRDNVDYVLKDRNLHYST